MFHSLYSVVLSLSLSRALLRCCQVAIKWISIVLSMCSKHSLKGVHCTAQCTPFECFTHPLTPLCRLFSSSPSLNISLSLFHTLCRTLSLILSLHPNSLEQRMICDVWTFTTCVNSTTATANSLCRCPSPYIRRIFSFLFCFFSSLLFIILCVIIFIALICTYSNRKNQNEIDISFDVSCMNDKV